MDNFADVENLGYLFLRAFIAGLQFDNLIASYIIGVSADIVKRIFVFQQNSENIDHRM
jgi:hypothetical protein